VIVRCLLLVLAASCATSELEATDEAVDIEAVTQGLCPLGQWCVETPQTTIAVPLLHAVWAVSATDVFAVGDGGTILRRVNGIWTPLLSGTTSNLRGVWAASSSDVWAVGVAGTVLRFNGTAWSTIAGVTTSDVDAVWGSSATDVWLVGSGQVTHWNGTSFSATGFGGTMLSVSGTGPRDVWVTGENTFLHHFTGTWTTVNPGVGTSTFFAVLALSTTEVWASDFMPNKETVHMVGTKWTAQKTGGAIFEGLSGQTSNDVWGAGGSRVGHWNGSAWTIAQPFGTNVPLWSVATAPGAVWVVGDSGLIGYQTF
jgi:hypothetical protein